MFTLHPSMGILIVEGHGGPRREEREMTDERKAAQAEAAAKVTAGMAATDQAEELARLTEHEMHDHPYQREMAYRDLEEGGW